MHSTAFLSRLRTSNTFVAIVFTTLHHGTQQHVVILALSSSKASSALVAARSTICIKKWARRKRLGSERACFHVSWEANSTERQAVGATGQKLWYRRAQGGQNRYGQNSSARLNRRYRVRRASKHTKDVVRREERDDSAFVCVPCVTRLFTRVACARRSWA